MVIPLVTVNWNEDYLLKDCLNSLADMNDSCDRAKIMARVIIVDNGSSDTSFKVIYDFVKRSLTNISFEPIWVNENLGPIGSYNLGIKRGFENTSVKYVATLANDTIVDKDWLTTLTFAANNNSDNKIGMFSSRINILKINGDKTDEPYNYGHSYHQDGACLDIDGTKSKVDKEKMFCHCNAGALLRRDMLEECGLADEDYFIFYDCPNLGWKARLKGWKPILVNDAKMWHRKSERRRNPAIRGFVERSRILTILRFMPIDKQPLALGIYLNQTRENGTTYEEKIHAIEEAHKLFNKKGQYKADISLRNDIYELYCIPRP